MNLFTFTQADAEEILKRPLQPGEAEKISKAIEHSSVPEALHCVMDQFEHASDDEDDETPELRRCYHSDESHETAERTFTLILIEEGQPGFWPVGTHPTLVAAQADALARNRALGLTDEDVLEIRSSSMAAHFADRDKR